MTQKEELKIKLDRLNRKICCINNDINNLLSEDILDALNNATNPSLTNVFLTEEDLDNYLPQDVIDALTGANAPSGANVFLTALDGGGGGASLTVVANYAALPAANTVTGEFYWAEASQGTQWLPGSLGGTYYPLGIYYSNGVSWSYIQTPYQATQPEVDAGTNNDKFVTPLTLENNDKWSTKADTSHTHVEADIIDLGTYSTDIHANIAALDLVSGTNTGDNAVNSLYSGLVSNATHTGEVTGSTTLTLDKTAITNQSAATVATGDLILIADIDDSNNLKQVTAQSIADLGSSLSVTQVTKTLTTGAWTLVTGLYEQDVSDVAITASSVVDVIPDNVDIATVKTAEILPRTESGSGTVKVFSTNLPGADIGVTLNIFK